MRDDYKHPDNLLKDRLLKQKNLGKSKKKSILLILKMKQKKQMRFQNSFFILMTVEPLNLLTKIQK